MVHYPTDALNMCISGRPSVTYFTNPVVTLISYNQVVVTVVTV